jgi:hypothetical protein
VKKESSNPSKGSGKRKNEPQVSVPERKKLKLEPGSDEGIIKQILLCVGNAYDHHHHHHSPSPIITFYFTCIYFL